jgi:hypothetical protein
MMMPKAGAVHELDVGEVKHQFARALLNQRIEQRFGFAEARSQREAARAGDPGDIGFELEDLGFQHHGCVVPLAKFGIFKVSRCPDEGEGKLDRGCRLGNPVALKGQSADATL